MRDLDCLAGVHRSEPLTIDHKELLSNSDIGKPVLLMRTLTSTVPRTIARSDISGKPFYLAELPDGSEAYLPRSELGLPYLFQDAVPDRRAQCNHQVHDAARRQVQGAAPDLRAQGDHQVQDAAPWFYRDPHGVVQGPFTWQEMYLWNKNGYFSAGLRIRHTEKGAFYPLKILFPTGTVPFRAMPRTETGRATQS